MKQGKWTGETKAQLVLSGLSGKVLGIKQAFSSYNNPKGNADTERFMRTMKEELVWLMEWRSTTQFYKALERWITEYNTRYLHSALWIINHPSNLRKQHTKTQHKILSYKMLAKLGAVHFFLSL